MIVDTMGASGNSLLLSVLRVACRQHSGGKHALVAVGPQCYGLVPFRRGCVLSTQPCVECALSNVKFH